MSIVVRAHPDPDLAAAGGAYYRDDHERAVLALPCCATARERFATAVALIEDEDFAALDLRAVIGV